MCRLEIDRRGPAVIERRLPACDANAPFIARFETGKTKFGNGRDKIVAVEHGEIEEIARNFHADGMQSDIFRVGATKPVAIKSGHRIPATTFQLSTKNVRRHMNFQQLA
jgi:hypothetical protein